MRSYVDTRERVARLLLEGLSVVEIARQLGISKSTVCYHKGQLGHSMDARFNRRYDWAEVQRYYDEGHTITQCQEHFGMARGTFSKAVKRGDVVSRPQGAPLAEVFSIGRRRNRNHLKQRLLRAGIKEYMCEECGLIEWRGRPLPLQLHHINGNGLDNRLENISLLCANCHSQTENWGGRKLRRRPS